MADKSILQPEPTEAAQAALAAASELQSELVQAKKRIEGFVNQNEKELSAAVSEHEAVMVALEDKIEKLKSLDAAAQSEASELSAQLRRESEMLQEKREQLEDLQSQHTKLPSQVQSAASEQAAAQAELSTSQALADLSKRQAELQYAMQELLGGQAMFERLGLRFDAQVGENVRVIFTQIDPAAPGREFVVGVSVNDADDFELRECTPAIPDMAQLLDEVNASADFSRFVQKCRAQFKAICAPAGASSS